MNHLMSSPPLFPIAPPRRPDLNPRFSILIMEPVSGSLASALPAHSATSRTEAEGRSTRFNAMLNSRKLECASQRDTHHALEILHPHLGCSLRL